MSTWGPRDAWTSQARLRASLDGLRAGVAMVDGVADNVAACGGGAADTSEVDPAVPVFACLPWEWYARHRLAARKTRSIAVLGTPPAPGPAGVVGVGTHACG